MVDAREGAESVMPAIFNQVIGDWIDVDGRTATSFMTTIDQSNGGAAAYVSLANAIQACCDARLTAIQFQTTVVLGGAAAGGAYATAVDRAVFLGNVNVTNRPYRLSLVGPKASIFQANNSLVDLSNPLVTALNVAQMAVLGDTSGNANGAFKRGTRQMAAGN